MPAGRCGRSSPPRPSNPRSRADKNYHLVVSFPEGEKPTRAQMEDIEDTLCAAIGFAEHQRVSATHQNTDNWHLHIAINKVHPRTFRNVEPWTDHYRLQECLRRAGNTARSGAHEPWSRSVATVAAQRSRPSTWCGIVCIWADHGQAASAVIWAASASISGSGTSSAIGLGLHVAGLHVAHSSLALQQHGADQADDGTARRGRCRPRRHGASPPCSAVSSGFVECNLTRCWAGKAM